MATVALNLQVEVSKRDKHDVDRLLVAALHNDGEQVAKLLNLPTVKRAIASGALNIKRGRMSDDD